MQMGDRRAEGDPSKATVTVVPDTTGIGLLEFHQIDHAREAGREAGEAAVAALRQSGPAVARPLPPSTRGRPLSRRAAVSSPSPEVAPQSECTTAQLLCVPHRLAIANFDQAARAFEVEHGSSARHRAGSARPGGNSARSRSCILDPGRSLARMMTLSESGGAVTSAAPGDAVGQKPPARRRLLVAGGRWHLLVHREVHGDDRSDAGSAPHDVDGKIVQDTAIHEEI